MGTESKRVDICVCITDSLCCTSETNTALQINYTPIKINVKKQEFLQQKPGSQKVRRILLIKEKQTSQVNEFRAFLCIGKCKNPGSLKLFL